MPSTSEKIMPEDESFKISTTSTVTAIEFYLEEDTDSVATIISGEGFPTPDVGDKVDLITIITNTVQEEFIEEHQEASFIVESKEYEYGQPKVIEGDKENFEETLISTVKLYVRKVEESDD